MTQLLGLKATPPIHIELVGQLHKNDRKFETIWSIVSPRSVRSIFVAAFTTKIFVGFNNFKRNGSVRKNRPNW